MKESRKVVIYSMVAIAVFAGLFGWRTYQMNKIDQQIAGETKPIIDSGLSAEEIPSIDSPKFVDVATADELLGDDLFGIDFETNGAHRFYPVQILNWHQVVNDSFGVEQIAVTFDPLTYSSAVYSRIDDGQILTLNASGQVYDNNTILMADQGATRWIQLTGQAVTGNQSLDELPSTFMKWGDWKTAHPNGEVLSSDTGATFDYTRHPYGAYDTAKTIYFPLDHKSASLSPKWVVTSYRQDNEQVSFAQKIMDGKGVIEEQIGGRSLVGFLDYNLGITRVFDRNAESHFTYDFKKHQITDQETGSIWSPEGLCISGKLKGTQLAQLSTRTSFWFAWSAQFPDSRIAGTSINAEPST
jgi:hypothetical protein